jgi:Flp pilus assembly protein TadG
MIHFHHIRPAMRSFLLDEEGQSLIEFSLCVTVLLMLVFGIMDMSRALYTEHFIATAAHQGARYAIVRGATFAGTSCASTSTVNCAATQANVVSYVTSLVNSGISPSNMTVTARWPGTDGSGAACTNAVRVVNSAGCNINVTVNYSYSFILPYLPKNALALTSSSSMTISQ